MTDGVPSADDSVPRDGPDAWSVNPLISTRSSNHCIRSLPSPTYQHPYVAFSISRSHLDRTEQCICIHCGNDDRRCAVCRRQCSAWRAVCLICQPINPNSIFEWLYSELTFKPLISLPVSHIGKNEYSGEWYSIALSKNICMSQSDTSARIGYIGMANVMACVVLMCGGLMDYMIKRPTWLTLNAVKTFNDAGTTICCQLVIYAPTVIILQRHIARPYFPVRVRMWWY